MEIALHGCTPDRSFAEVLAQLGTQRGTVAVEEAKNDTGESERPAEPAACLVDEAVRRHGLNMRAVDASTSGPSMKARTNGR